MLDTLKDVITPVRMGCRGCYDPEPCEVGDPEFCPSWKRGFVNQRCFVNHIRTTGKQTKTICDLVKKCEKCDQTILARMEKSYICPGSKKCRVCKQIVEANHNCFLQPFVLEAGKDVKFIFYDFECDQSQGIHVPYYCIAQKVCEKCIDMLI